MKHKQDFEQQEDIDAHHSDEMRNGGVFQIWRKSHERKACIEGKRDKTERENVASQDDEA